MATSINVAHPSSRVLASLIFYSLLFFAAVVVPAGLILVFLLFLDHRRELWHAIMQRLVSPLAWLTKVPFVDRLLARYPRTFRFLHSRLDSNDPSGLAASVAGVGVAFGLWLFFGVLQDIMARDPLVVLNVRQLHNSVPMFRTTGMTWLMVALTQLGSAIVLGTLCAGIAIAALGWGRPRLAVTFVLAGLSAGMLTMILKALVGTSDRRMR